MNIYFTTDNDGTAYGFDFSWECAPEKSQLSSKINLEDVFQLFSDDHSSSLSRTLGNFKPEARPEAKKPQEMATDFGSVASQAVKNVLNTSQKAEMSVEELASITGTEEKLARLIDQIAKGTFPVVT